jgi:hypothetical protein
MADPTNITDQQFLSQDPEVLGLQRQRQLANLLTGQAFNQPQGQVISGHYVKPSALQQALPMINAGIGALTNANLDTKQQELAAALRGKQQEAVQKYVNAQNPQERFAAGTSQYAPAELQKTAYGMVAPQKLAEGETINQLNMNTGKYEPMASGGEKMPTMVKEAAQLIGINTPISQWSPQELAAVNAKVVQLKQASANNMNINMGEKGFENALKLRDKFTGEPVYKAFQEVQSAKNQIDQAAQMQSPAGDLAAATKIMKILDPGSVVRESELGMAMSATGLEDKVRNYANLVITGQKLTPTQRKDFVDLSDKLYNVAGQQFNAKRNEYVSIAQANGLNVPAAAGSEAKLKEIKQPSIINVNPTSLDEELKRRGIL